MKRWLSVMMAAIMVLSCSVPVFADEGNSKELEKAILKAKSVIDIPQECTVFSSRSYEKVQEGKTTVCFSLEWGSEKGDKAVSAQVDSLGNFLEYHSYNNADERSGLGKISRSQAQKSAEAFLQKAIPEYAAGMKEVYAETNVMEVSQHKFTYRYYLNEVPVSFMEADITVDRYTGAVTGFNGFDAGFTLPVFPSASGVISKSDADKAWTSKLGLELNYYSYYDYKEKQLSVFLAYVPKESSYMVIDAKTGNALELKKNDIIYAKERSAGAVENAADTGAGASGLSPQEIARVEETASLISKEQAEQIIRKEFPLLRTSDQLTSASLARDVINKDQYRWQLMFTKGSAAVEASKGEILSFYYYDEKKTGSSDIGKQKAAAVAESFLQRVAPDCLNETKLDAVYAAADSSDEYTYRYNRMVNNCKFDSNALVVSVDKASGEISSFNKTWYESVSFPTANGTMTAEAAYGILDQAKSLQLAYDKTDKNSVALVYEFNYPASDVRIDPKTGVFLGYNGKTQTEKRLPAYSDLKGHWSEGYVTTLMENGYYLPGTEFRPKEAIAQMDFLRYIYSPEGYSDDAAAFYEELQRDGIIKEGEKNPTAALTRQDAAMFLVRSLSLQKAGEHPELFVNVFADQVPYEYRGYATLCSGLGILKGDSAGRFNGTALMTRGEAAAAICQMSQVK